MTASGNQYCIFDGFRKIAEQLAHLRRSFEIMLRCFAPALIFVDIPSIRDTKQSVMGLISFLLGEITVIRGNQRNIEFICQIDKLFLNSVFLKQTVTLQLYIKPVTIYFSKTLQ